MLVLVSPSRQFLFHDAAARTRGYSLVELIAVVAVLSVLLAIALPNLSESRGRMRLENAGDELVSDIVLARSEAAARGSRVVICPRSTADQSLCGTASEWINGRIVFVDLDADGVRDAAEVIVTRQGTGALSGVTLSLSGYTPSSIYISFSPYGGMNPAGSSGTFLFCATGYTLSRQVAVNLAGRPTPSWTTCP